jgi:hypothetical protein
VKSDLQDLMDSKAKESDKAMIKGAFELILKFMEKDDLRRQAIDEFKEKYENVIYNCQAILNALNELKEQEIANESSSTSTNSK